LTRPNFPGHYISTNTADYFGGGIYNDGLLTITNSTLSGNSADEGGGVYNIWNITLTINNSIVALNSAGNICGCFDGSSNFINIDPGYMHAPSAGADGEWGTSDDDPGDLRLSGMSGAINSGNNLLAVDYADNPLTIDLDGNPRITNGLVDIGAYEYQASPDAGRETPSLVVNVADDEFNLYDDEITLREAIYYSQFDTGNTITFDALLDGATITLVGGDLVINNSVVIDASTLSSLTLDADNLSRVFYISDDVSLKGLTITGGSAYKGGGIYNYNGPLTIVNTMLSGNSADYFGGGIYNDGLLTLTNSTLSVNSACYGGGILNHRAGALIITNTSIFSNSATSDGGGIANTGTLDITNTTLSQNSATNKCGGIYNNNGTLTIISSTLSSNSASVDG